MCLQAPVTLSAMRAVRARDPITALTASTSSSSSKTTPGQTFFFAFWFAETKQIPDYEGFFFKYFLNLP